MQRSRQRVKQACNRCQFKKTKLLKIRLDTRLTLVLCDGERVCNKCRKDNVLCDYSLDVDHQRDKRSMVVLLEEQNKKLRDTVQMLYECIRTGRNIPVLPARSPGDDRPLLQDIVAYVDALPVYVETTYDQLQHQVTLLSTAPTFSLLQSQPETSSLLSFAASEPQQSSFMAPSIQLDQPLTEYDVAQVDLQEFSSFPGVDPVEAAGLRRWP
ncbi:hypothetical protein GGP41_004536 [Bipolaris sorokiniana]|uniref:Zn(2)-C6 fungal-type domain-containing protein n=1 Tax=Cochliobolus sativus TaxID=45130 RepID=A0A8H6DQS7_COCSA|nr:hypothetical protein GGP41_004536 [Bipolaris sorokiniana]